MSAGRAAIAVSILLLLSGCTIPDFTTQSNATNGTSANPEERHFIYGYNVVNWSWPVSKTVATQSHAQWGLYVGRNLTVRDCFFLGDENAESSCLKDAAGYLNDSSLCKKIALEGGTESCYLEYALEYADAGACGAMGSGRYAGEVESCRRQVGMQTGNSSLCEYAGSESEGAEKADLCRYFAESKTLVGKKECREEIATMLLSEITYFGKSFKWMKESHPGEKVLSWWDYGLAMDCAGADGFLSLENATDRRIPETAYLFVADNETGLASFMKANGVRYVMLDLELIMSMGTFGGKYGALNYISCAFENRTSPEMSPGESECESEYLWETIYVPLDGGGNPTGSSCTISPGKDGVIAYSIQVRQENIYANAYYYPYECRGTEAQANKGYCQETLRKEAKYCYGAATLADGSEADAFYSLAKKDGKGNLVLQKANAQPYESLEGTSLFGDALAYQLGYFDDRIWLENGTAVGGYGDRTTKFYDSVLYKGIVHGELDGFDLIYNTTEVKIFEVKD